MLAVGKTRADLSLHDAKLQGQQHRRCLPDAAPLRLPGTADIILCVRVPRTLLPPQRHTGRPLVWPSLMATLAKVYFDGSRIGSLKGIFAPSQPQLASGLWRYFPRRALTLPYAWHVAFWQQLKC
jgi:hypothetical protein